MTGHSRLRASDSRQLFIYLIGHRIVCSVILLFSSYLPPFDSSHQVLWPVLSTSVSTFGRFISTILRWDSFHFLEIAQNGYTYEYLYAFLPGTPTIMRASSLLSGYGTIFGLSWVVCTTVVSYFTLTTLYDLTLVHTGSQELAMLATTCSILTTSPATLLHAPYAELPFSFFSYKGGSVPTWSTREPHLCRNAIMLSWSLGSCKLDVRCRLHLSVEWGSTGRLCYLGNGS